MSSSLKVLYDPSELLTTSQNTLFCLVSLIVQALLGANCVCTLCGYMITIHSTAVELENV